MSIQRYDEDLCPSASCSLCCGCEQYERALADLKSKIDEEFYDGGYGTYHEVEMIVRMIEKLKEGD